MTIVPPLSAEITNERSVTSLVASSVSSSFILDKGNKTYKHQYSNIYFARLRILRETVEAQGLKRWGSVPGKPTLVPRVLDVVKSQLCYIVGTVYLNMPLKPNVMEDIARDHSIPPPPSGKIYSPDDEVMLEDESGRIRLVGKRIMDALLVTGVIMGALGMETQGGDFEVIDICFAGVGLEPIIEREGRSDIDNKLASTTDEWVAVVSGLNVGAPAPSDATIHMLVDYLSGEGGTLTTQQSAARVARLIIAGNSISALNVNSKADAVKQGDEQKSHRRGDGDSPALSPYPIHALGAHLLDIAQAMPIHILPGESDPSGTILPQQPLPRAMFGPVSKSTSFTCESNPTYLHISHSGEPSTIRTLLVHSGQPLDDMFHYLPSPPHTRLDLLESTLRWRHMAPTAPDTLWCHPYFADDPFIMTLPPDIYLAGGQKQFATRLVESLVDDEAETKHYCRVILVPDFSQTGILVLISLKTLEVKIIKFALEGMTGGPAFESSLQNSVEVKKEPNTTITAEH